MTTAQIWHDKIKPVMDSENWLTLSSISKLAGTGRPATNFVIGFAANHDLVEFGIKDNKSVYRLRKKEYNH